MVSIDAEDFKQDLHEERMGAVFTLEGIRPFSKVATFPPAYWGEMNPADWQTPINKMPRGTRLYAEDGDDYPFDFDFTPELNLVQGMVIATLVTGILTYVGLAWWFA